MKVSGFEGAEVEVGDDFLDDEEWVKFEEAETGRQVRAFRARASRTSPGAWSSSG